MKRELKATKWGATLALSLFTRNVRILRVSTNWIRVEQFTGENVADFIQSIAFPQREQLARFTANSI